MPVREGKGIWKLRIDRDFQELIRPLFKNEYLQLEENLIADGCREPIAVWNDVIVDGHNRYKICTEHQIPFAVEEMSFNSKEEVIAWICANQLGRRNLTEESRKYLIGKQYESEKIISKRNAVYQDKRDDRINPPYETFDTVHENRVTETKKKTAERIAEENHISHGTVEKYSVYTRAIEEIQKKEPHMASKILSGRYKISHNGVLDLAKRSPDELRDLNTRLEQRQYPFAKYQTTRREILGVEPTPRKEHGKQQSIKDMPAYDPDAEVVGLTLTIPSWSSSINRIVHTDFETVSVNARRELQSALLDLRDTIANMMTVIREE
jgi:hypothetical protein